MESISKQVKEQMIQNYINSVDFGGDFSVAKMKSDLKTILHEMPALEVKYVKNKLLTEDKKGNKVSVVDEKVKSVVIAFTDGFDNNGNIVVHRVEFYI
jgi:hypothetical protein